MESSSLCGMRNAASPGFVFRRLSRDIRNSLADRLTRCYRVISPFMLQRKMIGKFVCESFKRWDLSHGNALELNANDLGIFVDESGEQGTESKYYLMALVFRDQSKDISLRLTRYEQSLADAQLPNIPLHALPLMNGHDDYKHLDLVTRKRLLNAFAVMFQRFPVRYVTFLYRKNDFDGINDLAVRMKRDIVNFLFDHLVFFQSFDKVKVYYVGGQPTITDVLHSSIGFALSKDAILYRKGLPAEYRLVQAADFVCAIELTDHKYHQMNKPPQTNVFWNLWRLQTQLAKASTPSPAPIKASYKQSLKICIFLLYKHLSLMVGGSDKLVNYMEKRNNATLFFNIWDIKGHIQKITPGLLRILVEA